MEANGDMMEVGPDELPPTAYNSLLHLSRVHGVKVNDGMKFFVPSNSQFIREFVILITMGVDIGRQYVFDPMTWSLFETEVL